jgi:hypothetical protein
MPLRRYLAFALLAVTAPLLLCSVALAQLTMVESGFLGTTLSDDFSKQVEMGVGPDTCLYYGSFDGLKRRCGPSDPGTVCDPNLTYPVGIAFSTGGSFGAQMYVADYGINDIYRSTGCSAATLFAPLPGPGSIAFPPSGSAYGDYLYACTAFDGPIHRISSTGVVTDWLDLQTVYLRFGPGGAWGTGLYATDMTNPGDGGISRVSSAGVVTPLVSGFLTPEGFDWGFDGDMFMTDASYGQIMRVKPNGAATLFATLQGAADVAYRPGEQALYVVSNQGGFYRITRSGTTGVSDRAVVDGSLAVTPNPTRGACMLRFTMPSAALARVQVVDVSGRVVRRLTESWRPAGVQSLSWDGRDEDGAPVRPGTFFLRVRTIGESRSARVTIVR